MFQAMWSNIFRYIIKNFSLLISLPLVLSMGCAADVQKPWEYSGPYGKQIFRKSPDSVRPGSINGPFTGTILDADTKKPLSGVKVQVNYFFTKDNNHFRIIKSTVRTDSAGKFEVPALTSFPPWSPSLKLTRVQIVAAMPGFYHSSSDTWGNTTINSTWTQGFSQYENTILLRKSGMADNRIRALDMVSWENVSGDSSVIYYKATHEILNTSSLYIDAGNLINPVYIKRLLKTQSFPMIREKASTPESSSWELVFDNGAALNWRVWSVMQKQAESIYMILSSKLTNSSKIKISGGEGIIGQSENYRIGLVLLNNTGHVLSIGCASDFCSSKNLETIVKDMILRLKSGTAKPGLAITDGNNYSNDSFLESFNQRFSRILMEKSLVKYLKNIHGRELGIFENLKINNSPWLKGRLSELAGLVNFSGDSIRLLTIAKAGMLSAFKTPSKNVTVDEIKKLFRLSIKGKTPSIREAWLSLAVFYLGKYLSMPSELSGPWSLLSDFFRQENSVLSTGELWVEFNNGLRRPVKADKSVLKNMNIITKIIVIPSGSIFCRYLPVKNGKLLLSPADMPLKKLLSL
ncbi:hypothetical protein KKF34_04960 [Myxococcota bacterium]|nr:hypothetical protein [Myxococcota bacterium]MBU1381191.1 hypothetical protein [Myxococcota bacterium]MBU1496210.1 hypothetical protein [Myxococcota bacterium]